MPSSLTKTAAGVLAALQSIASNTVVISSAIDVSAKFAIFIAISFGRRATTTLTTAMTIRIEGSPTASGDADWVPLQVFTTQIALSEAEAATGTNNAGQKVITVASTTNLTKGSLIYIDNTTIGNSEWHRIKAVDTDTSITLEDNLANAQNSGAATIYTIAEKFQAQIDVTAVIRVRAVFDGSDTGQAVAVKGTYSLADSIG